MKGNKSSNANWTRVRGKETMEEADEEKLGLLPPISHPAEPHTTHMKPSCPLEKDELGTMRCPPLCLVPRENGNVGTTPALPSGS